jgi:hypothetical protein
MLLSTATLTTADFATSCDGLSSAASMQPGTRPAKETVGLSARLDVCRSCGLAAAANGQHRAHAALLVSGQ